MPEKGWIVGYEDVLLREIVEADLQKLMEHRNDWETRRWLENPKIVTMDDQRKWFNWGAQYVRAAESEGIWVGIARVKSLGETLYEVGGDVFKEHRGKGFGHSVFNAACNRAYLLGAKTLSLWVFMDNMPAVNIYQQAGFEFDIGTPIKTFLRPGPMHYVRMVKG